MNRVKQTDRQTDRLVQVIWFNGMSTVDGRLMPNLIYTYIDL